ncbi:unnamed protein product [Camellia sinensis]
MVWGIGETMSAQKKRNFQIEAFKHRVVVDPKYAEKTWKILEHAIQEIYNHKIGCDCHPSLGTNKTLVLREIPEDGVQKLLPKKDFLAACDKAVFLHDRVCFVPCYAILNAWKFCSDESSWERATELLVEVASHGEATGYEVPCLIVAPKDDLDPFPTGIHDSTRVSQDMGIDAPIPLSTKLGDFNNVFRRIVTAAERPHLSIPETEAGRSRKQYHKLINRSLMFVSESKQEFNGNYSVQVYTVQACIPKYPAALWNAEFVQAEELLRQPSTIDNCLVTLGI